MIQTTLPLPVIILWHTRRNVFQSLLKDVFQTPYTYVDDPESLMSRGMSQLKIVYAILAIVTVSGATSLLTLNSYINSRYSKLSRELAQLNLSFHLPYPFRYPIDVKNSIYFRWIAFMGQLLSLFFTVYFVVALFYVGIILLIQTLEHIQAVIYVISNIKEASWELYLELQSIDSLLKPTETNLNSCLSLCFKMIFKRHQDLVRWQNLFIALIESAAGILFISVGISIALNLMTVMNPEPKIPGWAFYSLIFLIGELLGMWVFCILGQLIVDMSEQLSFSIYSTEWYTWSRDVNMDLIIFLGLLQRPLEIKLWGSFSVRFTSFKAVIDFSTMIYRISTIKKIRADMKNGSCRIVK
uniref:Odorant receptor n=1 Tax=Yemma signatus TaxID=300820 RepID=A0A385H502_9HEMI|nr:odorant receptor [Yemma signatus]